MTGTRRGSCGRLLAAALRRPLLRRLRRALLRRHADAGRRRGRQGQLDEPEPPARGHVEQYNEARVPASSRSQHEARRRQGSRWTRPRPRPTPPRTELGQRAAEAYTGMGSQLDTLLGAQDFIAVLRPARVHGGARPERRRPRHAGRHRPPAGRVGGAAVQRGGGRRADPARRRERQTRRDLGLARPGAEPVRADEPGLPGRPWRPQRAAAAAQASQDSSGQHDGRPAVATLGGSAGGGYNPPPPNVSGRRAGHRRREAGPRHPVRLRVGEPERRLRLLGPHARGRGRRPASTLPHSSAAQYAVAPARATRARCSRATSSSSTPPSATWPCTSAAA